MKRADDFVAACPCGWFKARMYAEVVACRTGRAHINRVRTPGHRVTVVNVSKLEVVATYERRTVAQLSNLFDRPPF